MSALLLPAALAGDQNQENSHRSLGSLFVQSSRTQLSYSRRTTSGPCAYPPWLNGALWNSFGRRGKRFGRPTVLNEELKLRWLDRLMPGSASTSSLGNSIQPGKPYSGFRRTAMTLSSQLDGLICAKSECYLSWLCKRQTAASMRPVVLQYQRTWLPLVVLAHTWSGTVTAQSLI